MKETQSETNAASQHQLRHHKSYNIVKDDILTVPENASLATLTPNESALLALAQAQTASTISSKPTIVTSEIPKRLHVTNLPFKVRDPELRSMFAVSMTFSMFAVSMTFSMFAVIITFSMFAVRAISCRRKHFFFWRGQPWFGPKGRL